MAALSESTFEEEMSHFFVSYHRLSDKEAFNCIYKLAQKSSTFICLENVLFSVNSQFKHTLRIVNTTHTTKVVQPDAVR